MVYLQIMYAHSQYCWTGDHTLSATELAVKSLAEEDSDESIVVVLSDANLQRYGIPPSQLGAALTACPNVSAYVIFIGGLGNQAEKYCKQIIIDTCFVIFKYVFFLFQADRTIACRPGVCLYRLE